jgi:hypothetical protein
MDAINLNIISLLYSSKSKSPTNVHVLLPVAAARKETSWIYAHAVTHLVPFSSKIICFVS